MIFVIVLIVVTVVRVLIVQIDVIVVISVIAVIVVIVAKESLRKHHEDYQTWRDQSRSGQRVINVGIQRY